MDFTFHPSAEPPGEFQDCDLVFGFAGARLLLRGSDETLAVPSVAEIRRLGLSVDDPLYLGRLGERHCYALSYPESPDSVADISLHPLRAVAASMAEDLFVVAGRALQVLHWDKTHRYCGQCGGVTERSLQEHARNCASCNLLQFPRLSPAVIVLVKRGREVLLGRGPHHPPGMHSILAGFVEPGESLEQAVHREIWEEARIHVANLRYFGSQPWPFPHSLMVGFTADYASGELQRNPAELEHIDWYTKDNLPTLPMKASIARKLIDAFLHGL